MSCSRTQRSDNTVRLSNGLIQIRTDILIWIKRDVISYQQTTKVAASKERY